MRPTPRDRWRELTQLLDRGPTRAGADGVRRLCRLYRQVTIDLSHARAGGDDPARIQYLNALAARAHGQVYAADRVRLRPMLDFVAGGFARTLRTNWKPVAAAALVFVLSTLASGLAVVRDPEVAYSLFDERVVEYENVRLEKQEGEYRGNFTFGAAESPLMAVVIIGNNVRVALLAFGLGALGCVLGVLLLVYNGRMLGTLSGLVYNGGYLAGFTAIIAAHGVLELSAICISAAGGLRLGWAVLAPGRRPRADALRAAAGDAFRLLAGAVLMLLVAGVIEAFVTPHFSAAVRWTTAATTGGLFAAYVAFAGRTQSRPPSITSR